MIGFISLYNQVLSKSPICNLNIMTFPIKLKSLAPQDSPSIIFLCLLEKASLISHFSLSSFFVITCLALSHFHLHSSIYTTHPRLALYGKCKRNAEENSRKD